MDNTGKGIIDVLGKAGSFLIIHLKFLHPKISGCTQVTAQRYQHTEITSVIDKEHTVALCNNGCMFMATFVSLRSTTASLLSFAT